MQITIRVVSAEDAADIAMLSHQLGYAISKEKTAEQILAINASRNDVAYIATENGKAVGWIHVFCTLRLECAAYCEIGGLVVDEQHRGKGIGKMLIDHIKPWCRERHCHTLKVRSNTKRTAAHRFYEQAGFKEIKQQKVFETAL